MKSLLMFFFLLGSSVLSSEIKDSFTCYGQFQGESVKLNDPFPHFGCKSLKGDIGELEFISTGTCDRQGRSASLVFFVRYQNKHLFEIKPIADFAEGKFRPFSIESFTDNGEKIKLYCE
jgi:hypothetical protein